MDFKAKSPPRQFTVKDVTLSHTADITLAADELVTFQSPSGKEIDLTAKEWGYYITGSTNGRLRNAGYRTVLTTNPDGLIYVLAFEIEKEEDFQQYLAAQDMKIIAYLDEEQIKFASKNTPR